MARVNVMGRLSCSIVVVFTPASEPVANAVRSMIRRFASIDRVVCPWQVRPGDSPAQSAPQDMLVCDRIFVCLSGTTEDAALAEVYRQFAARKDRFVFVGFKAHWVPALCSLHHDDIRRSVVKASRRSRAVVMKSKRS